MGRQLLRRLDEADRRLERALTFHLIPFDPVRHLAFIATDPGICQQRIKQHQGAAAKC